MILHSRTHRTVSPSLVVAAGAVASVLAWWSLSDGTAPAPSTTGRIDAGTPSRVAAAAEPAPAVRVAPVSAPARTVVPAASPQAPPVQYIGRWVEGRRTSVVLGYQGRNVVVRVPGSLDERYDVVSADDRQVVVKDNASGSTQGLPMSGDAGRGAPAVPPTAAMPAVMPTAPAAVIPNVQVTPSPRRSSSRDAEPEN